MATVRSGLFGLWFLCAWATTSLAAGTSDQQASKEGLDFSKRRFGRSSFTIASSAIRATRPRPKGTCCSIRATAAQRGAIRRRHRAWPRRKQPVDGGHSLRRARNAPQGQARRRSDRGFRPLDRDGSPDPRSARPPSRAARSIWPKRASIGPSSPPRPRRRRRSTTRTGRRATSINWCGPSKRLGNSKPVADADKITLDPPGDVRSDGTAPDAGGDRIFVARQLAGALSTVVDRLLGHRRNFGERGAGIGSMWSAMPSRQARNETYLFVMPGAIATMSSTSFNADKPYNRFVVEQIAGDLLPAKNAKEKEELTIATGFLALAPKGSHMQEAGTVHHGSDRRSDRCHRPRACWA